MFELPELEFAYDALEPHFDAETMEIHHSKHHAGYTNKLNAALTDELNGLSIEEILKGAGSYGAAIRNNAGGFYNHKLFWNIIGPDGGNEPTGDLAEEINQAFGSYSEFQDQFAAAAASRFGSGWAWLVRTADGKLQITSTPNQDNPLMDVVEVSGTPIIGLDVWEHAYYSKYQNKRPDYINAFWSVLDWNKVA